MSEGDKEAFGPSARERKRPRDHRKGRWGTLTVSVFDTSGLRIDLEFTPGN